MGDLKSKTLTLNDDSYASDPGLVQLSKTKLRRLQPGLFPSWRWKLRNWSKRKNIAWWHVRIEEQLSNGDSRAAVVMQTRPLLIAAYTDELDCVAMLHFPLWLVSAYNLREGSRLLTVNTYSLLEDGMVADLTPGERDYGQYGNFAPYIAEFLSDDMERIAQRKAQIDEDEWRRAWRMGQEYLQRHGLKARDGSPVFCMKPAAPLENR